MSLLLQTDAYAMNLETVAVLEEGREAASQRRSAECDLLEQMTGWRWDPSELQHFLTRPKSFSPPVARWRRDLVGSLKSGSFSPVFLRDEEPAAIRRRLDDVLAVVREIGRILALLYPDVDQKPQGAAGEAELPNSDGWETLSRIEPFRALGIALSKLGPDDRNTSWQLVPPPMRTLLSARLMHHAEAICHGSLPDCKKCELSRFCHAERSRRVAAATTKSLPTAVDLFSGAGGISLGFSRAGFRPVLAIDANSDACTTYRLNHHEIAEEAVLCADIREVPVEEVAARLAGRPLDVLLAAPPCQGFSVAGFRSKQAQAARRTLAGYSISEDERNYLFEYVVGMADALRPKLLLMENVPGMDSPRAGKPSFMRVAEQMLRDLGFLTAVWKLDAAAYGVPQRRVRSLLVASSVGRLPSMPEAEFQQLSTRSFDPDALPPITTDAAIFDLPPLEVDGGSAVIPAAFPVGDEDPRHRFYLRSRRFPIKGNSSLLFNHRCRYHNAQDLELYSLLRPGEDSVHVVERHGRGDLMRYRRDVFDDKYARLRSDRPSKTIVSHLAKDGNSYVHPTQNRSITPREAARLQSFPDDFVFCGSPSEQWVQIGNSVPPALAAAIAKSFHDLLARESRS